MITFRGCSADAPTVAPIDDAAAKKNFPIPKPDPPAEPASTPPSTSKVPATPKRDLPRPVQTLRDKVARDHCESITSTAGEKIEAARKPYACRFKEQKTWLNSRFLYNQRPEPNSCTNQVSAVFQDTLNDRGKTGRQWVKKACKAAVDKALEGFEGTPTENQLKERLDTLLTAEGGVHNIAHHMIKAREQINHNCSANDSPIKKAGDRFPNNRITANKIYGGVVKANYLYRRYYDYSRNPKIPPLVARYWNMLTSFQAVKYYRRPYDTNESSLSHSEALLNIRSYIGSASTESFITHKPARDIITLREVQLKCAGHQGAYNRPEQGNSNKLGKTFFDATTFWVSHAEVASGHCAIESGTEFGTRHITSKPKIAKEPVKTTVPPLSGRTCKVFKNRGEYGVECSWQPSQGNDLCGAGITPVQKYCAPGSGQQQRWHRLFQYRKTPDGRQTPGGSDEHRDNGFAHIRGGHKDTSFVVDPECAESSDSGLSDYCDHHHQPRVPDNNLRADGQVNLQSPDCAGQDSAGEKNGQWVTEGHGFTHCHSYEPFSKQLRSVKPTSEDTHGYKPHAHLLDIRGPGHILANQVPEETWLLQRLLSGITGGSGRPTRSSNALSYTVRPYAGTPYRPLWIIDGQLHHQQKQTGHGGECHYSLNYDRSSDNIFSLPAAQNQVRARTCVLSEEFNTFESSNILDKLGLLPTRDETSKICGLEVSMDGNPSRSARARDYEQYDLCTDPALTVDPSFNRAKTQFCESSEN
ncbi:MAG: hypothetical protein OXC40_04475 [Proteobacteria bacterium]|nr:hypothetical protein [Pseudomonadota bacterium]